MNYQEFLVWLETERKMGKRSAKDVASRLRRVAGLLSCDTIDSAAIPKLDEVSAFNKCTISVKSQLRRSVALYLEYLNK